MAKGSAINEMSCHSPNCLLWNKLFLLLEVLRKRRRDYIGLAAMAGDRQIQNGACSAHLDHSREVASIS